MKLSLTLLALIVCLNLSAQKDKKVTCKWFEGTNGTPSPSPDDFVSVKKGAILYSLFNDDKNIYFESKITESIEQNRVLQMGLTLWINIDGRARKINGIRFPMGAKFSKGIRRGGSQENAPVKVLTPLAAANTIELIGFKNAEVKKFPSDNDNNIRGSVKYDNDGNLIYSMIIPFSKLPTEGKSTQGKPVPFNFAIEYGGNPPETEKPSVQSTYTPPSGGARGSGVGRSGGGGGGGSRGGSSGGGGTPRTAGGPDVNAPESTTIWIKDITLAEKK